MRDLICFLTSRTTSGSSCWMTLEHLHTLFPTSDSLTTKTRPKNLLDFNFILVSLIEASASAFLNMYCYKEMFVNDKLKQLTL